MSTGNPLEQIRRRMQSHATPTAFAALAEEHRRAGRFDEAIAVCRDGLSRYPAYVSARVTLGRALLDSGDAAAALAELEQAVAQAPDNLAAARALESVHTALGNAPPPPLPPPMTDLPLHGADGTATPAPRSVVAEALADAPDGPQEFGFGPDWSLPGVVAAAPDFSDSPQAPPFESRDAVDEEHVPVQHSEAPTMCVAPPPLPGEEPAGIWAIPELVVVDAPHAADGVPVHSWAIDPPAGQDGAGEFAGAPEAAYDPPQAAPPDTPPDASVDSTPVTANVWDAPTMEAPLAELFALAPFAEEDRDPSPVEPLGEMAVDVEAPAEAPVEAPVEMAAADGEVPASEPAPDPLDDHTSPFWTGSFGGEPQAEQAAPFSGWGDDAPPAEPGADRSPWSDDAGEPSGSWHVPDGPSAAWALDDLHEAAGADATPFARVRDDDTDVPAPPPLPDLPAEEPVHLAQGGEPAFDEPGMPERSDDLPVEEQPAANEPPPLVDVAWAGSVKSALGEVFARAGRDESLEPPTHPSPVVRAVMADTAVEAALEDAVLRDDEPTSTLASLQQLLASVRARRAALSQDLSS